jgi:uncharacterized protein
MRVAVLAATGATGRLLATQSLERGHDVVALARTPDRLEPAASSRLRIVAADVTDPMSIVDALAGVDAVVSALGHTKGGPPDVLTLGASSLAMAHETIPDLRVVWLGAFGTGRSAARAGGFTRAVLKLAIGSEIADKVEADELVLGLAGSVFHAGPLTNRPISAQRSTVALDQAPRRLVPRPVSRATVAAAMLDEVEHARFRGVIAVPLSSGRIAPP